MDLKKPLDKLVLREWPETAERKGFLHICALREWIYANTVVSAPMRQIDCDGDTDDNSVEKRAFLLQRSSDGFYCGDVARVATRVYHKFGIPAFDINIGLPDSRTTHVVNIVPFFHPDGRVIFTVQDAYLDYTLIDARGAPLDWRDVVTRLVGGRHEDIIAAGGGGGLRPVLVPAEGSAEAASLHPMFIDAAQTAQRTQRFPDGAALYWTPIMRPRLFERAPYFAQQYQVPLQTHFGQKSILHLFRLPLSTSGEREVEELADEVRAQTAQPYSSVGKMA